MKPIVHVAVAVIRNQSAEVFITRRPDHAHQGGLWEFPGGKVEKDESVQQALSREILEETGIEISEIQPLIKIPFQYSDKQVLLDVWDVKSFQGKPHGREGQPFQWIKIDELRNVSFPAANRAIVSAVQLPEVFLVTPEPQQDRFQFLDQLENNLFAGLRWIYLRARHLSRMEHITLAQKVCELCVKNQARVMLSLDLHGLVFPEIAGFHATNRQLLELSDRPTDSKTWFSASCHTEQDVYHANKVGADFILVGAIQKTQSHEDREPAGWQTFEKLVSIAQMPVYAIGGMTPQDVVESREKGGQGIAAINALWKN